MAMISLNNVAIKGIAACVPGNTVKNGDLTELFAKEDLDKIVQTVGIKERRVVDASICASDLCVEAANKLLSDLAIDRSSIDALIFMSQTGDYKIPATSPMLQTRLGLSQDTLCFDIGLACSGYIYSLTTAAAYLNIPTIKRILVLDGETFSKIVNPTDKTNALLYGDAGTATLLEKNENSPFLSKLYTDGSGWNAITIKDGGCRNPVTQESFKIKERPDGGYGNDLQLEMNGIDVFNFTMRVVPKSIKDLLETAQTDLDHVDYIVFHQANKFMTDFFAKKLKCPINKIPYSLQKFGNTSSSTIPLTIVSELREWVNDPKITSKIVLLSGFGAGLSWGSILTDIANCYVSELIEL